MPDSSLSEAYNNLHATSHKNFFPGKTVLRHRKDIKYICSKHQVNTILDYGCGKGLAWSTDCIPIQNGSQVSLKSYLGTHDISYYDPGVREFSELTEERHDLVISIDVLEHIPEDEIPSTLDLIFQRAHKHVYLAIASYPARKFLPDGSNAHITIKTTNWWEKIIVPYCLKYNMSFTLVTLEKPHTHNLKAFMLYARKFFRQRSRRRTCVEYSRHGKILSKKKRFI